MNFFYVVILNLRKKYHLCTYLFSCFQYTYPLQFYCNNFFFIYKLFYKCSKLKSFLPYTLGYSRWQCLHIIASKQQQPKHKCCHLHKGFISWKPISSLAEQFQAAAAAKRKTVNVQTVFRTQESDPVSILLRVRQFLYSCHLRIVSENLI